MVRLHRFVREALAHRVDGLKGCAGGLINAMPTELDANAAAAMHLRERYQDRVADVCLSDWSVLGCSLLGPEPLDTLPARMVAFAFIHRGGCAKATQTGMPLAAILDDCYEGASELWSSLEAGLPSGA